MRKFIISLIAILGLSSIGALNANAASRHVRHPIKVYKYYPHRAFYRRVNLHHHIWLHRGKHINVWRFYHMGRDGFILHVYGHSGEYYARTNSSKWFR